MSPRPSLNPVAVLALFTVASSSCSIFSGGEPCDVDKDCSVRDVCRNGFCEVARPGEVHGGEGEGEGAAGEGEGAPGEGEGAAAGEGEGVGGEGEGEGPATIAVCQGGVGVPIPAWFDTNAQRRMSLGFCDPDAGNEDVIDLPVSVGLFPEIFDFSSALPDGSDIFFVDGRTNQPLPFEKAQYQSGTFAMFFVRVPAFNPHTQTDALWMYWDDATPPLHENVADTWTGHVQVWHMDGAPTDGTQISDGSTIRETISGASPLNAFASAANGGQGETVFGISGLLGNSLFFDAGGVGCGAACVADSFVILPPPPGLTLTEGSISVVVGAITESNNATPPVTKTGVGGGGCADGSLDCGHLWMLGEAQQSQGFDAKSMHVSTFAGGKVGVSRPETPATPNVFSASSGGAVIGQAGFSVVTTTWTAAEVNVTVTALNTAATDIVQTIVTSANPVVPFTISNFTLGVAEKTTTFASAGDVFASIEEVRVSSVTRTPAYVRAEAVGHLGLLLGYGTAQTVP